MAASGCLSVTIYQPQKAIHRPVVVQHSPKNFEGLRILVRCNSHEDFLPPDDASKLCNGLVEQFRNQGAEAEAVVPQGGNYIEPEVFEGARPDLTLEIDSRIDYEYEYSGTVVASILTLTMVPAVEEQTFSQRVVVYGRDGSVLNEEVYRERFVEYRGLGVWSLNYLLDWFFRSDDDALSGDAAAKDFSRDFYGQMRQLTFNARIRSEVLGLTAAPVYTARGDVVLKRDSGSSTGEAVKPSDQGKTKVPQGFRSAPAANAPAANAPAANAPAANAPAANAPAANAPAAPRAKPKPRPKPRPPKRQSAPPSTLDTPSAFDLPGFAPPPSLDEEGG